jgi:hypothetical protein
MAALKILVPIVVFLSALAAAQQQPQVRVNYLNVCAPAAAEQKEIGGALARIARRPAFAADFEVARGRSALADSAVSRWVRIRREFRPDSPFTNVQYSFSVDEQNATETLVFRLREAKDVMQVSVEQSAATARPEEALAAAASVTRIRLERFGKSSVALARCGDSDQSAYEPLFRSASEVLAAYRTALDVRRTVPGDLARIEGSTTAKSPGTAKKLSH